MAAQPDSFVIGEEELVESIVEAVALATATGVADHDLNEADEDIEGGEDLMDDDEDIAVDLPDEMTFGHDDDIPPYESD